jgi:DNA-binding beta-propeller fold protein YncE
VYVANTDQGTNVRIRVVNGEQRQPTIWVLSPALLGADGIAFDVRSNWYVAVDRQNTIAVVRRSTMAVRDRPEAPEAGPLDNIPLASYNWHS